MAKLFGIATPLWTRLFPKDEGPRGLQVLFPLSTQASYTLNMQLTTVGLQMINGVFIDNSLNAQGFTLTNPTTGQKIFIPAFSQGRLSLLTQQSSDNVSFVAQSTGGVDVNVIFTNTEPVSDMIWAVIPPGSSTGSVIVTGQVTTLPLAAAVTDHSTAITVGGTSQILMPANAARKRLIIQNPFSPAGEGIASAEPIFFRFGAAAGINDGSSFELYPGASYDSSDGPVFNGAIQFNAATTGHRVIATEF
jgi:hypothetical protein